MEARYNPPLGTQGNLANAAAVLANANTGSFDTHSLPFLSVFGHCSAAATLTLMLSQDNTNFYAGPTVTLAGAGDFAFNVTIGARYVALQTSANATITATASAK